MTAQQSRTRWVVQRVSDEGTKSPYVARLWLGVLELRNFACRTKDEKALFDRILETIQSAVTDTRQATAGINELWSTHCASVQAEKGVRRSDNVLHIEENIDHDLRRHTETFLNASVRGLKYGLQQISAALGTNIGFWFGKDATFEKSVAMLADSDPHLAAYMTQCRKDWLNTLVQRRNAVEHDGWKLARVTYADRNDGIQVIAPLVDDIPVQDFVASMQERVLCTIEEILTHALKQRIPAPVTIVEIPLAERDPESPKRFRTALDDGNAPKWNLTYHGNTFEKC